LWVEVRPSDLDAVVPDLLLVDEDAAALWPRGWADLPAGVRACAGCWEELHGYMRITAGGRETCAPMLIIDIIDSEGASDDCHLTHSVATLEA